jgi:hypothetical protein
MGRSMHLLIAAGAALATAAAVRAGTVLSYSLPDPLNYREQGQWGALAACPLDGPCDVGYTVVVDTADGKREKRITSRLDLFTGDYAILLLPRAGRPDTHRAYLNDGTQAGPGSFDSYRDVPSVIATPPHGRGTPHAGGIPAPSGSVGTPPVSEGAADPPAQVPEPVTLALTGIGLAVLALKRHAVPHS